MLVTDASGSMQARDVAPDRLTAARTAADAFIARLPEGARVGAVAFNDRATTLTPPTDDRAAVHRALSGLQSQGGTATGDGIEAALKSLRASGRRGGAIVLLSDGKATSGRDPVAVAEEAGRRGVPVYTVALGTPEGTTPSGKPAPPDPASLQEIAERSGGASFTAQDAEGLSAVYERLGSQVAMKKEPREITGAFAGGAMLLLLTGGGLSLRWFRRLI
jgi:Ca-activated chloride channel homolog